MSHLTSISGPVDSWRDCVLLSTPTVPEPPMFEDYEYTLLTDPKSDLRLIEIEPGASTDPSNGLLKCSIQTYDRRGRREISYTALSYTWGDPSTKLPISLNGKLFFVTPNLDAALRNLRVREGVQPSLFWIDAICIDQQNSDERDQQVQRMKRIYKKAAKLIIWLGEYHEPRDDDLRMSKEHWGIDQLEPGSRTSFQDAINLMYDIAFFSSNDSYREERIAHYTQETWAQLARIFHRSWFERLWIIQELAAGRNPEVLCGGLRIHWNDMETAAAWILRPDSGLPQRILRILPRMGAHRINQVSLRSMLSVDTHNILTVLHNTQEAKCTDPRDRLYAILGVVEDTADVNIDYSIPVQAVYRNWAERRIRRRGFLDVLGACADTGRSGDLTWPSWVPDLRRPWGQDKSLWLRSNTDEIKSEMLSRSSVDVV